MREAGGKVRGELAVEGAECRGAEQGAGGCVGGLLPACVRSPM